MIKSSSKPLVSVIMPVHNCGDYLYYAIDSILAQTYTNFEFLIITRVDATAKDLNIINSYADHRIRHIEHNHGAGIVASLLVGIKQADGKYIARMDGDDISLPQRLEKQVKCLESHPEIGVLGSWARKINEKNKFVGNIITPVGHAKIAWTMAFTNPLAHPTVMLRRQLLSVDNYNTEFLSEDYWLWCRLIFQTRFENLPQELIHYRFHAASSTNILLPQVITGGLDIRLKYWQNFITLQKKKFIKTTAVLEGKSTSFLSLIRTIILLGKFKTAFKKRFDLSHDDIETTAVDYRQRIKSAIRWYLKHKIKWMRSH